MAEASVTCPICLNTFKDPKILPCGHTYCKDPCLTGLAKRSNYTAITCPECRQVTQLQAGNVDAFPTVYKIVSLVDSYKAKGESVDQPDSASRTCQIHQGQEIALYCETCSKVVCRDCVVSGGDHRDHKHSDVKDIVLKSRETLHQSCRQAQSACQKLLHAMGQVKVATERVSEQKAAIIHSVETTVTEQLAAQRIAVYSQLDCIAGSKIRDLERQSETMTRVHSELLGQIQRVQTALEALPDTEFAVQMGRMHTQLENVSLEAAALSNTRVVDDHIHLHTANQNGALKFHLYSGQPSCEPIKCTFCSSELQSAEYGKPVSVLIKAFDSHGRECNKEQSVTAELHCIRDLSVHSLAVCRVFAAKYLVEFTPTTRGRHMLAIKVNGQHILGSPTPVFVHMPPQKLSAPVATIGGLERPAGLHFCNGKILACELNGNRLIEIDTRCYTVREVAKVEVGPAKLSADSDSNVYLTTCMNNRLYKLDRNGHIIKTIGSTGSRRDQFSFANGVTIFENKLYVADTHNDRIKVYDFDLNLIECFGKKGDKLGQFQGPGDTTFDKDGTMYVPEQTNNRIQVFSPQRMLIRVFPVEHPITIRIVKDLLYVTPYRGNCVLVYTTTGLLQTSFGIHHVQNPEGLEIDEDGYVYVTSHRNKIVGF